MLIQRYNIGGAPLVHFGTISTSCALFGSIMYTFACGLSTDWRPKSSRNSTPWKGRSSKPRATPWVKWQSARRPVRAKALLMVWYFKAFALTGRQVCDRNNPGRCPGLGASALSGRVGENLRNPEIRKSARRSGDTQVVLSATPDSSVSESRRLDKSTDTTPLAYVVDSLTRCSRILNLVQPSA